MTKALAAITLLLAASVANAEATPETTPSEVRPWERRYPSAGTGAGGARGFGGLLTADSGETGTWRFSLRGSHFQVGGFPAAGGEHRQFGGELSASYTLLPRLELYGAYRVASNLNTSARPNLVQSFGDVVLGTKRVYAVGPASVGADVRLVLMNGAGGDLVSPADSQALVRGVASYPVTIAERTVLLHANLGGAIAGSPRAKELSAATLYGTGFSAYSRVLGAIGAQLELGPFTAYAALDLDIPLGVDTAALTGTDLFAASTKRLSLGTRYQATNAVTVDVGADLAHGTGAAGFAAAAPYQLHAALSFALDPVLYAPPPPPPPPPAPTTGRITGRVLDISSGEPVPNAVVALAGGASTPVATDEEGRFTTRALDAGPVTLEIRHAGYQPSTYEARVAAGKDAPAEIHLQALPPPPEAPAPPPPPPPPPPTGFLAGLVEGPANLLARVHVDGPEKKELRVDESGRFSTRLAPGVYSVLLVPEGHFAALGSATVLADDAAAVVLATRPLPARSTLTVEARRVVPVTPLALDEKKVAPAAADRTMLAELADLVLRDPTHRLIVRVHAEPPTKGGDDRIAWTGARAQAIRQVLVELGAPADRITAIGEGATKPLEPAPKNPLQHRRVEFDRIPLE